MLLVVCVFIITIIMMVTDNVGAPFHFVSCQTLSYKVKRNDEIQRSVLVMNTDMKRYGIDGMSLHICRFGIDQHVSVCKRKKIVEATAHHTCIMAFAMPHFLFCRLPHCVVGRLRHGAKKKEHTHGRTAGLGFFQRALWFDTCTDIFLFHGL